MARDVLSRRQMNSSTIEVAKINSPEYLKKFDRNLELTKNGPKWKCLNVIGVRQEYSGRGGPITKIFSWGKIYFSGKTFIWAETKNK